MNTTFANRLRKAIADSGLNHAELSRQTGVPQPTINRFVNGADFRLETAEAVARYLGLVLVHESEVAPAPKPKRSSRKKA